MGSTESLKASASPVQMAYVTCVTCGQAKANATLGTKGEI